MNKILFSLAALSISGIVSAHVTPNVSLVRRGDFIQQSLPGATKFFERSVALTDSQKAELERSVEWIPSREDTRVYDGRTTEGRLVGSVVFLWMPSEHGPVGIGVAFDSSGVILRAAVTDVGTEPLAWVRPLIDAGGMAAISHLSLEEHPDPARIAPSVRGRMNRYYAEVIAAGVSRTQALVRVLLGR